MYFLMDVLYLVGTFYSIIKRELYLEYIFSIKWAFCGSKKNLVIMYFFPILKYILDSKASRL